MTDPVERSDTPPAPRPEPSAREIAAQLWCLPKFSAREMDVEFAEAIAQALRDMERRTLERAARVAYETIIKDVYVRQVGLEAIVPKAIRALAGES